MAVECRRPGTHQGSREGSQPHGRPSPLGVRTRLLCRDGVMKGPPPLPAPRRRSPPRRRPRPQPPNRPGLHSPGGPDLGAWGRLRTHTPDLEVTPVTTEDRLDFLRRDDTIKRVRQYCFMVSCLRVWCLWLKECQEVRLSTPGPKSSQHRKLWRKEPNTGR